MTGQTGERVEIDIRFRLSDFFWLNLRARWRSFLLSLLLIVLILPVVAIFYTVQHHEPLRYAVSVARDMSPMWDLIVVAAPALMVGVPILTLTARWYLGSLSRRMRVVVEEAGLTYSGEGYDVTMHWEKIRRVERRRSSYFFHMGPALLRVPRRSLTPDQQAALEATLSRHGL